MEWESDMTTVAPSAIEAQAEYTSRLEAEVQSYADELAEARQTITAQAAEILRLRAREETS